MIRTRQESAALRHLDEAASLLNVGVTHHRSGDEEEAARHYYAESVDAALRAAERLGSSTERLTRLKAMQGAVDAIKASLIKRQNDQSSRLIGVQRHSEPITISRDDCESVLEARSDADCSVALFNAALLLSSCSNKAIDLLRLALASAAASDATTPSDASIAAIKNLGYAYFSQGRYGAAASAYESLMRSCRLRIDALRDNEADDFKTTDMTDAVRALIRCMTSLARSYDAMGRLDEASLMADEASSLLFAMEGRNADEPSADMLALTYAQALVRQNMRQYSLAISSYKSVALVACNNNANNEGLALRAATLHGIGECLLLSRKHHESEPYLLSALTVRQLILDETHEDTADTLYLIGRALHFREEYGDAVSCYEKALLAWRAVLGEDDTNALLVLRDLARAHRSRNDLGTALSQCREALDFFEQSAAQPGGTQSNCPVRKSLFASLIELESALLEETDRTDAALTGDGKARRRASKPGSCTAEGEKSYGWMGRCPDAAAA